MLSPNLGGNLMCQNTSISSCIREHNTVLDFSFENRTQHTNPSRLNNVTSDVTSVSFTFCTFSTFQVKAESNHGGGAILLHYTSSSLTIHTCSFHNCTCSGSNINGGAAFFTCSSPNDRPLTVSHSSFSECAATTEGGSIYAVGPSSLSVTSCFFFLSKSGQGGGLYIFSLHDTVSSCSFVECNATGGGGGALLFLQVETFSLSFSQFRRCSCPYTPASRDIYFYGLPPETAPDMIQFCDSTSGAPNIYFFSDNKPDSTLIPQLQATPRFMPLNITFDGDEAIVTLDTEDELIQGTLNLLLYGPNVPRLVYLVYDNQRLFRTGLTVGNALKITLNSSLSFIATVTSDTGAKSTELQIGWPTTLQHNTQYTLTSVEAMDEADGPTLFAPATSNTTGSLPDDVVIFIDSESSSESSLFCGDRTRPCTSIEDGWKIVEGIGILSLSLSILHNTTQTEQVRILSDHQVVIESGRSTNPALFLSPSSSSSSKLDGEGMVEVTGGHLWIRQVDVVLSNSPSLIFIRMVGGHLMLKTCSLTSTSPRLSNSDASICLWKGGAIVLEDATTSISSSTFSELPFGAININGGNLTIDSTTFRENSPNHSSFPSARRNIRCSGEGTLMIGSLSGGDGQATLSAWISASDCELSGEDVNVNAPFFIPTLSSSSISKLNKKEKTYILTINGTTLIPCSLFLEVFEKQSDGMDGQKVLIPLSENSTTSFTETTIVLPLPLSTVSSFDDSLEWRGRLVYGKDQITNTSFVVQKNAVERKAQALKETMMWLLPVVISLTALFVIVLVIVIVCCRRRREQKNGQKDAEMNESDEQAIDEQKDEGTEENQEWTEKTLIERDCSSDLVGPGLIVAEAGESREKDERIPIDEDETNKKENPRWTRPGDDTIEEVKRDSQGVVKDEGEAMEEMKERPHKKKRKKMKSAEECEKAETTEPTPQKEEQEGVEGLEEGSGEGMKKRKKKKKGVEEVNTDLLIVDEQNGETRTEDEISQTKEGDAVEGEKEVKKQKKKKKKQEVVVEDENTETAAAEEIEGTMMQDEPNTFDNSNIVEEVERPKRKKKKRVEEMREEEQETRGKSEVVEIGGEETHHVEEEGTKKKKKGRTRGKEENEDQTDNREDAEF
ncbi:hypothetical protein BLNAU_16298 [Blattamonas nauphoetae]|uniref:Right handed beta helix domain-containing protein n=1 Tax=Blattamonas nauphoetae TaxID=2049346 RepID=A0ABQ9X8I4_9EUKA|nr:hypothetical protein BLNAU_16298 [Blattamonas nauphoetae]